jgi:hypothetical protein
MCTAAWTARPDRSHNLTPDSTLPPMHATSSTAIDDNGCDLLHQCPISENTDSVEKFNRI